MPLRVKLTLWYGSVLALILILLGTTLYAVLARELKDQVDQSLEEAGTTAIRSLEQHGFGPFIQFDDLSSHFPELAVLDKFFQIFSPTGRITIQSPNVKSHDVPLSQTALETAFRGHATYESARFPGESLRLISVPIMYQGNLLNIVQVGTSLKPVEEALHRLLVVLLVSLPVALLASLAGGWFLAGRALRPVHAITEAAQKIAGGDLTQRLTVESTGDEIGRLAATFNDMIARLDASFRQIRQFSSDASHELRTPLTVMKGETELVLRRDAASGSGTGKPGNQEPGASAPRLIGPGASAPRPMGDAVVADPVLLEIFNNQFAGIAQQMGVTLRNTASSVNVKERLDFSCAVFTPEGDLVVNAQHIPVHLGAMSETVKRIIVDNPQIHPGDVFVTNDPYRGGSHLPDVTVVTPVHHPQTLELLFFTASRAHHAEIGGIVPGSMPPFSTSLAEEGVLIRNFKLVDAGASREAELRALLSGGRYPSRSVADNLADVAAQVAANNVGVRQLSELIERHTLAVVHPDNTVTLSYRPVHLDPLTPAEKGGIELKKIAPKARVY